MDFCIIAQLYLPEINNTNKKVLHCFERKKIKATETPAVYYI